MVTTPSGFQLSTFLVFLAQLFVMYVLFVAIFKAVRPAAGASTTNHAVALLATAWYGLHPAMAETVNYIIQRGDVYCAFGVVAALAIYARWPRHRRTGIYLLPLVFALLSKPPAAVFPILLVLCCRFFGDDVERPWIRALRASLPSLLVCAALMALQGKSDQAAVLARETLRLAPTDRSAVAAAFISSASAAAYWINASLDQYQSGNYQACIADAQQALRADPNSALAYNNIGAAYAGLQQWNLAIRNEREALRLDPKFVLAQNNLAAYAAASQTGNSPRTPEDWLNVSLRDFQAGQYRESIADAQNALKLRPSYAEAYNNIAASYAALHQWDRAIAAAQKAVSLKPDLQLARNNLAWAESQLRAGAR